MCIRDSQKPGAESAAPIHAQTSKIAGEKNILQIVEDEVDGVECPANERRKRLIK